MDSFGTTVLQAVAALALLFFGGEILVRGASALALRLGLSPLTVGLTVVAFGTSAPELIVSVDAALSGANDISVGNVVGSNIANIALILGLAALVRPVSSHARIVRFDMPVMILVSLVLVAILANGGASRLEGLLLMLGLFCYIVFTFRQARAEPESVRQELSSAAHGARVGLIRSVSWLVAGLATLVGGGHFLVTAAINLAAGLGVSQAAIGLTIVAVGTSLPELATSVIASVRGQGDIAIGNVIGSNIFNILGILGATAAIRPLRLGGVSSVDLGLMVLMGVILFPLLVTRSRLGRLEGAFLLAIFVFYSTYVLAA